MDDIRYSLLHCSPSQLATLVLTTLLVFALASSAVLGKCGSYSSLVDSGVCTMCEWY
jgi:hypothetical protein